MERKRRARRVRGTGSVFQREDGQWCAVLELPPTPAGKRRRRYVYGRTAREVQEQLRRLQNLSADGRLPDRDNVTVGAWLAHWLKVIAPTVEAGTLVPYRRHVEKYIAPRVGTAKLRQFRRSDVQALYAELLADGVSAAMTRKVGVTLTAALNAALASGDINANPATGVKKPKAKRPQVEVLTPEQAAALAGACDGPRLGPMFLLMLDAGTGPGETFALTWGDLDADRASVGVTKSLEEISGKLRVKVPKTAKRNRTVTVSTETAAALARHKDAMKAEGWSVARDALVFVAPRAGGFLRQSNVYRNDWHPLLKAAGLPEFSLYSLRHTMATLLLLAGVNPKVVSERLGHASITLTLDTYSHVLPSMQQQAADVMGKWLNPPEKKGKS